jgi:hypothetical protein
MARTPRPLVLLRIITGAGLFIGVGGILIASPSLFWIAAVFLYAALIALTFESIYEFKLKRERWLRRTGIAFAILLTTLFSWGIAFYPDKLQITPYSFEGQYKSGDSVFGIIWRDDVSDLRIEVSNQSDRAFEHLDLTINVGMMSIRGQQQISKVPGVSFEQQTPTLHLNFVDNSGKQTNERNIEMDGYNELRVGCDRLPKKTTIDLILAVSALTPQGMEVLKTGTTRILPPPFNLWMRKRAPTINIKGDYSALNRPYEIDRGITVTPK